MQFIIGFLICFLTKSVNVGGPGKVPDNTAFVVGAIDQVSEKLLERSYWEPCYEWKPMWLVCLALLALKHMFPYQETKSNWVFDKEYAFGGERGLSPWIGQSSTFFPMIIAPITYPNFKSAFVTQLHSNMHHQGCSQQVLNLNPKARKIPHTCNNIGLHFTTFYR